MRILLTRPRHESEALAHILTALGHEIVMEALLSVVFDNEVKIVSNNPQAIIITSVNGARGFSNHIHADHYRQVPVYVVGAATADALKHFNVVHVGCDGVAALINAIRSELVPDAGPVLYVRGVHVAGTLADDLAGSGYQVDQVVIYEAVEKEALSPAVIEGFQGNRIDGVVLFSPRTAVVFSKLIEKAGLNEKLGDVTFYCLSQNVSDNIQVSGIRTDNQSVIAEMPTQTSLISSIRI